MVIKKYTREFLLPIVESSTNFWQVAKKLSRTPSSIGTHHLRDTVESLGIPTDHFVRSVRGGRTHQIPPAERLVLNRIDGQRESTYRLRQALFSIGREEVCAVCGQIPVWMGQPLRLQMDHINGNGCDNRPENLRFLCPNCHTQTPTFNGGNKRGRKQRPHLGTVRKT